MQSGEGGEEVNFQPSEFLTGRGHPAAFSLPGTGRCFHFLPPASYLESQGPHRVKPQIKRSKRALAAVRRRNRALTAEADQRRFRKNASTVRRVGMPACPPARVALRAAAAEASRMRSAKGNPAAKPAAYAP